MALSASPPGNGPGYSEAAANTKDHGERGCAKGHDQAHIGRIDKRRSDEGVPACRKLRRGKSEDRAAVERRNDHDDHRCQQKGKNGDKQHTQSQRFHHAMSVPRVRTRMPSMVRPIAKTDSKAAAVAPAG